MPQAVARVLLRVVTGAIALLYVAAVFVGAVVVQAGDGRSVSGAGGAVLLVVGASLLVLVEVGVSAVVGLVTTEDARARRDLQRALAPQLILGASGIAAMAVSMALDEPAWIVGVALVGGLLLLPVLTATSRAAARRDIALPGADPVHEAQGLLRRASRRVLTGVAIALLAVGVLVLVLQVVQGGVGRDGLALLPLALQLVLLGGAIGAGTVLFRVTTIVRGVIGPEFGRVRRIARVVVRGRTEPLSEDERRIASEYALVVGPLLRVQRSFFTLLLLSSVAQQAGALLRGRVEVLPASIAIASLVLVAAALAWYVVGVGFRLRRIARYAAAHPPVPSSTP